MKKLIFSAGVVLAILGAATLLMSMVLAFNVNMILDQDYVTDNITLVIFLICGATMQLGMSELAFRRYAKIKEFEAANKIAQAEELRRALEVRAIAITEALPFDYQY